VSHAHALVTLLERRRKEAIVSQADLARALGIDKSNVARLCSKMEATGHVTQTRAAGDGRVRLVALTDEGAHLAAQIERASVARFRRILAHIDARRRSLLFDSLSNLNTSLAALRELEEES
jgi:DNA-binding MarR family transcriptional regulator